jgi:hypothetical protein
MTVKMWPVLPKDDPANGLGAIETALNDNPDQTHIVVAILNRRRATIDDDANELTPTARICAIEVINGGNADQAREMLLAARKARTGSAELPFEDADGDRDGGEE